MDAFPPTPRTTVRRLSQRGVYDRAKVYAILDEGFICHVGFAVDGQPYVIPTGYARSGDQLYVHGSSASRMLRAIGDGLDVCVTVTLVDGFVLSRSAFHHSINYRSVVIRTYSWACDNFLVGETGVVERLHKFPETILELG